MNKEKVASYGSNFAAVGSADQDGGPGAASLGEIHVRGKVNTVPHANCSAESIRKTGVRLRFEARPKRRCGGRAEDQQNPAEDAPADHAGGTVEAAGFGRAPKRAVPTRIMVAPSSIATSKSPDIPMES